jgi:mono/diheme cytochrome c family protein
MIWLALLLQISMNPKVAAGEKVFAQSCSVGYCHGAAGAAARGPRLRGRTFDENYLYSVIRNGIPKSAMPAWKDRLKEEEIRATVAYIQSLGPNPAPDTNPKTAAEPHPSASVPSGPSESATRGMELFFEEKGCGSCHSLAGRGMAVGPDVSQIPEDSLIAAIRATHSTRVRTIKLKDGESFPCLIGAEDGAYVHVFDLTEPPPVSRALEKAEIDSIAPVAWSHQSVAAAYSPQQLSDILAFIRWAAR